MKSYLMLFWNEAGEGSYIVSPEEMQAGMAAWQEWIGRIAAQGRLLLTHPIEYEGSQVGRGGIIAGPALKEGFLVTGFLVCKAESEAEAQGWAADCPILRSPRAFTEIRAFSPFEA